MLEFLKRLFKKPRVSITNRGHLRGQDTEAVSILLTKRQSNRLRRTKKMKGISMSFQVRNALETQAELDNENLSSTQS